MHRNPVELTFIWVMSYWVTLNVAIPLIKNWRSNPYHLHDFIRVFHEIENTLKRLNSCPKKNAFFLFRRHIRRRTSALEKNEAYSVMSMVFY